MIAFAIIFLVLKSTTYTGTRTLSLLESDASIRVGSIQTPSTDSDTSFFVLCAQRMRFALSSNLGINFLLIMAIVFFAEYLRFWSSESLEFAIFLRTSNALFMRVRSFKQSSSVLHLSISFL